MATGINHPEYCQTYAFCSYNYHKYMCPRCHREAELKSGMDTMDKYAKKYGEKALANRMGLK